MKRMYLLLISITLVALLSLASCVPGWGQPGRGGMMGGQGGQGGMMGPGMMGPGMMGGWGTNNPNAEQITIDDAAEAVERYLGAYGQDLILAEVMQFAWNFYVAGEEESTGIHAM